MGVGVLVAPGDGVAVVLIAEVAAESSAEVAVVLD